MLQQLLRRPEPERLLLEAAAKANRTEGRCSKARVHRRPLRLLRLLFFHHIVTCIGHSTPLVASKISHSSVCAILRKRCCRAGAVPRQAFPKNFGNSFSNCPVDLVLGSSMCDDFSIQQRVQKCSRTVTVACAIQACVIPLLRAEPTMVKHKPRSCKRKSMAR